LQAAKPGLWDDPEKARHLMRQLARVRETIDTWKTIEARLSAATDLVSLSLEEANDSLHQSLSSELSDIQEQVGKLEFQLVLSGEYDEREAILAVHAGAGGTDSQDWAQMLLRMYLRWSERQGYLAKVLDISHGDEAGVKSAVIEVSGPWAYGYLKAEIGVHRLVRLSPFDSAHLRHTSFAKIEVLPEPEEETEVIINSDELRIDVFHAGGAGGQNVNKVSTAIRITHIPSGIVVSCQNERSQLQNRTIAMKILKARLMERERERRAKEQSRLKGENISAEWGNQIRSYILHPYKLVKDHRTEFEATDPNVILDGELDGFLKAYLLSNVGKND
jgi:peptide chain release factor 2